MKRFTILLLFASCALTSSLQAQPIKRFSDVANEPKGLNFAPLEARPLIKTEPFELTIAPDKPGLFFLKARFSDSKELLQALVETAGGQSSFKDPVRLPNVGVYSPVTFSTPISGTIEELIEKVAQAAHISVKCSDKQWIFSANIVTHFESGPTLLLKTPKSSNRPDNPSGPDPDMNFNPAPGKNLSEDAQPFDFNGKRWYHVPLT